MPKMKTKKAASKRFKVRKSGSISRGQQGTTHLLTGRSRKVKRNLRQNKTVDDSQARTIKRLIQG